MREMKDSGLKWVGSIPTYWDICKVKHIAASNTEVLPENSDDELEIDYIEIGSVTYEGGVNTTEKMKFGVAPSRARRIVHNGDTIVSTVRTYLKAIAYISDELSGKIASTGFSVVTPNKTLDSKFVFYALSTHSFISDVEAHSVGISYPAINNSNLMDLKFALPPREEQIRIADYLDSKCSKIDEIIEKQQQIIEKLKEYKLSVITEAVTKGLNPDVEMKDSGVEWIGKIPIHWKITKTSNLYEICLGKMLQPTMNAESDTLEYYLCAANLGGNILKYEPLKQMWFSEKEKNDYKVKKGDLLVVEGGDVASCAIVQEDISDIYIQNALHRVRSQKGNNLSYLRYFLMAAKRNGYMDLVCNKATIAHFSKEKFMAMKCSIPEIQEQNYVVAYLDNLCEKIDTGIGNREKLIEKLQEYKKSLIYEVVTGKKEV